mmetsp:Transcript_108260/g.197036  ORF Transcript_108260/g.197036 Transcript_108260/m.197036 type:complete len:896 (-) Transcript_108260:40-2727(-)
MVLQLLKRMLLRWPLILILGVAKLCWLSYWMLRAYRIRLHAVTTFGLIIHEFDPWFNYRAAEYLAEHGLGKFFKWYDYMSWYPLGRPIGTTIYPGMQIAAVVIRDAMTFIGPFTYKFPAALRSFVKFFRDLGFMLPVLPKEYVFTPMSVNDICCMIPPWFGAVASLFCGLLTYEVTRSTSAGVAAIGIMAVIPAHLMRSMGGEFDNEAVAMSAICCTFWLWCRSVRTPRSWPFGIFAGLSYIYMVAAWGGYIFVINMIGVHALMLVCLGRFNSGVHLAYTFFFVIGTAGAIQIPVVGWQPLRSLEQMGPLLVFFGYQVLAVCDMVRRRKDYSASEFFTFRVKGVIFLSLALCGVAILLYPTGYFGPLSSRIRGLFVKHTKTGNPLVDSVAEHQPASSGIYRAHLHLPLEYALHGALVCAFKRNNGAYFLLLYAFIAQHFSGKMSRLVLICAPIASIGYAIWAGFIIDQWLQPFLLLLGKKGYKGVSYLTAEPEKPESNGNGEKTEKADKAEKPDKKKQAAEKSKGKADSGKGKTEQSKPKKKAKASSKEVTLEEWEEEDRPGGMMQFKRQVKAELFGSVPEYVEQYELIRTQMDSSFHFILGRALFSVLLLMYMLSSRYEILGFVDHAHRIANQLSNPKVVIKSQDSRGRVVLIDDYLAGYKWIDKNTPEDSRVMSWWDYGYQITGIAKRTSLADGNTWNHEHIATLGRTLTSPEKKAWNAIRHLADYVLVWAGGRGDDLAKSPHLARIGNSVFPDHCGDDDPKCTKFGFRGDQPTPMMANSLLYKAVMHNLRKGVNLDKRLFKEVHTTKHGLMRVFKVLNVSDESKAWVADPANRVCDAPGSWYCVGRYPPALEKLISKRRNFAQLEDFNSKGGEKSAYAKMIEKERAGRHSEM